MPVFWHNFIVLYGRFLSSLSVVRYNLVSVNGCDICESGDTLISKSQKGNLTRGVTADLHGKSEAAPMLRLVKWAPSFAPGGMPNTEVC